MTDGERRPSPDGLVILRPLSADGVFVGLPVVEVAVVLLEVGLGSASHLTPSDARQAAEVARRRRFAWAELLGAVPGGAELLDGACQPWTALT